MANGLRMLLALGTLMGFLAKVESPPLQCRCGDGEYCSSGICCTNCPAGTHVDEPCSVPHTLGSCATCTEGKDYTAYENGLDMCRRCDECKYGRIVVKSCSVKSNTVCRCKDGYYCPQACEECLKCKTRCPEGQITVQNCNATADMECGSPPTGVSQVDYMTILYIALPLIIFILIIGTGVCCKKHGVPCRKEEKSVSNDMSTDSTDDLWPGWKKNTEALATENQEAQPCLSDLAPASGYSDLPESTVPSSCTKEESSSGAAPLLHLTDKPVNYNVQSNVLPSNTEHSARIKPSHDELNEICEELPNKVLVRQWIVLMRNAGLSDNERDIIEYDYPSDTCEQKYRMLKTLCDRFGPEDTLCKLLNGLQKMKLTNIYENVQNELLSKNIEIVTYKGKCVSLVKYKEQSL